MHWSGRNVGTEKTCSCGEIPLYSQILTRIQTIKINNYYLPNFSVFASIKENTLNLSGSNMKEWTRTRKYSSQASKPHHHHSWRPARATLKRRPRRWGNRAGWCGSLCRSIWVRGWCLWSPRRRFVRQLSCFFGSAKMKTRNVSSENRIFVRQMKEMQASLLIRIGHSKFPDKPQGPRETILDSDSRTGTTQRKQSTSQEFSKEVCLSNALKDNKSGRRT